MIPEPISGTAADFPVIGIAQVLRRKVVGDTGFEPVTSTVCKSHKKKGKRKL
jgi:hypothetical protein